MLARSGRQARQNHCAMAANILLDRTGGPEGGDVARASLPPRLCAMHAAEGPRAAGRCCAVGGPLCPSVAELVGTDEPGTACRRSSLRVKPNEVVGVRPSGWIAGETLRARSKTGAGQGPPQELWTREPSTRSRPLFRPIRCFQGRHLLAATTRAGASGRRMSLSVALQGLPAHAIAPEGRVIATSTDQVRLLDAARVAPLEAELQRLPELAVRQPTPRAGKAGVASRQGGRKVPPRCTQDGPRRRADFDPRLWANPKRPCLPTPMRRVVGQAARDAHRCRASGRRNGDRTRFPKPMPSPRGGGTSPCRWVFTSPSLRMKPWWL